MNKSLKGFLLLSLTSICILIAIMMGLNYVYVHSSINAYEILLIIIMMLITIITMLLMLSTAVVLDAYRRKKVNPRLAGLYKAGLGILLPIITFFAGLIKFSKDDIRKFYVDVNNIVVQSAGQKFKTEQVLILLPHCLQNSACEYKITSDIRNCRKCGRCCIGEILEIAENTGVNVVVATGGTLARNVIAATKPEFILSVACERDLTSGIADVWNLPVLGIINERPMGPCHNTTVNVSELKEKLEKILYK